MDSDPASIQCPASDPASKNNTQQDYANKCDRELLTKDKRHIDASVHVDCQNSNMNETDQQVHEL